MAKSVFFESFVFNDPSFYSCQNLFFKSNIHQHERGAMFGGGKLRGEKTKSYFYNLTKENDFLPLAAINDSTEEGKNLLNSAKQILSYYRSK